jgi:hypothetical protein
MTKGQKRLRNTPVFYDELKKSHTVKLTDTAWHEINKVAQQQGISASELIERWGRGLKSPTASSHP